MIHGHPRKADQALARIRVCSWILLLLVVFFLAPTNRTHANDELTAVISTATPEGRMAVFDDVWSTINERYYDRQFNGLSDGLTWQDQRAIFRSLAAESASGTELYAVLRRMLAALNDPHTRVFSPADKFDWWKPRFVTVGLAVKEIGGLPTVVGVERGSAPEKAGMVPGDVIEKVNDQPALAVVQKRLGESAPLGTPARSRAFAAIMEGPPDSEVEIRWQRKDGTKRSAQFPRYWQQRELGLRIKRDNGIAIVEIDAFTSKIAYNFTMSLREKLQGARGIILDLRNNGGGDAEAMTDIASAFLKTGFSLGRFIDRQGTDFAIITRGRSPLIPERLAKLDLPIVVLSSERTSSAAEIFIAGLRAAGRATVIGTQTCGCVLAIRTRHELPDGGLLDISELDYQTASGYRLERNGIRPDQTVVIERSDLYSGRDRALRLAIDRLRSTSHAQ